MDRVSGVLDTPDDTTPSVNDGQVQWHITLACAQSGKPLLNPWNPTLSTAMGIFRCPESNAQDNAIGSWTNPLSYATHPIAMPVVWTMLKGTTAATWTARLRRPPAIGKRRCSQ